LLDVFYYLFFCLGFRNAGFGENITTRLHLTEFELGQLY
jgi:hypothetical protein